MKLADVYKVIVAAYPKRLSDEYVKNFGAYDNSGMLLDTGDDIAGAVFSLDLSQGAISHARETGANLIVTHHPAIFHAVSDFRVQDVLGARLVACMRGGIGVISMHLNFDFAPKGVDYYLAEGIGCKGSALTFENIEGGGYGRVYDVPRRTFSAFCGHIEKEFNTKRLLCYGKDAEIARAASFCGAGVDGGAIRFAKENGADVIISSDVKHNYICDILESGMRLVVLTHYASENYGFKKIYQDLRGKLNVPSYFYEDEFML